MIRKTSPWILFVLLGLIALGPIAPAEAGFIQAFSGNTTMQGNPAIDPSPLDLTVNFAVLDRTGGVAGDTFGTGLAGFDSTFTSGLFSSPAFGTGSNFLYLYQFVNNGPDNLLDQHPATFVSLPIQVPTSGVTSWGSFAGTGFSDNNGLVSTTNNFGADTGVFTYVANPTAPIGVTTPSAAGIADGVNPFIVYLSTEPVNSAFHTLFLNQLAQALLVGQRSILVGFTSNFGPTFDMMNVLNTTTSAVGFVPTAIVPEPSSWILALGGAALGLGLLRRKRKA